MSTPIFVGQTPLQQGRTMRVTTETATGAGTKSWVLTTSADALLASLYVVSVAGTLTVDIYTQTDEGRDLLVASFPVVSSPTANLLLKKVAQVMSHVKIVASWTASTEFEIYGRGINSAEASVKILGASSASATQATIPNSPTLVIPVSITDRTGMVLKNNNSPGGSYLYLGFTALEASSATGYPISPQESLGIDVAGGVAVYGFSASGSTDVRILQSGG